MAMTDNAGATYPSRVWEETEDGLVSRPADADDMQRRAAQQLGFPVQRVSLPETYERARQALAECQRVDECAQWNDKAWALQAYARQIDDDELMRMAVRIRLRALRQAGLLLADIDARGWHKNPETASQPTKLEVARAAGLTRHSLRNATRIASMEEEEFESAAESTRPPSVSALARSLPPLKAVRETNHSEGEAEGVKRIWPDHEAIRELRDAARNYIRNLPPTKARRLRSAIHNLGPLDDSERQ